jgi:regulator of sirC expression with transglutaminase-like and TPR domain
MPNRFSSAAKAARDATNKQLASELASVSKFSRDQINELLPTKKDKEAFIQLMAQVEADTTMDEKLAFLTDNIQTAGKVALTLLKALV